MKRSIKLIAATSMVAAFLCAQGPAVAEEIDDGWWGPETYEGPNPVEVGISSDDPMGSPDYDWSKEFPDYKASDYAWNPFLNNWR